MPGLQKRAIPTFISEPIRGTVGGSFWTFFIHRGFGNKCHRTMSSVSFLLKWWYSFYFLIKCQYVCLVSENNLKLHNWDRPPQCFFKNVFMDKHPVLSPPSTHILLLWSFDCFSVFPLKPCGMLRASGNQQTFLNHCNRFYWICNLEC